VGLEKLYVLGTPVCEQRDSCWAAEIPGTTSRSQKTVVRIVHANFRFTSNMRMALLKPCLSLDLKTNQLKDNKHASCMAALTMNSLAWSWSYMGAPFGWQWLVRNDGGAENAERFSISYSASNVKGDRHSAVTAKHSRLRQRCHPSPWAAQLMGILIEKDWPQRSGTLFNRLPISPAIIYILKQHRKEKLDAHVPEFAQQLSLNTAYQKQPLGRKAVVSNTLIQLSFC